MVVDVAYKDYKKKNDIHGTVLYPAVMVAPVQKLILEDLFKKATIKSVFDPFHGSGTALYECLEISNEVCLVGCDINPLANLITKVKLQGVSDEIFQDIDNLRLFLIGNQEVEEYSFPNIQKWFRHDIANELRKIRKGISSIECEKSRLYFWCMLSDIVRKYSNTRSSTYKLHMKCFDKIAKMSNSVIEDYLLSITNNANKFLKKTNSFELFKCDTLEKIKDFNDEQFDISITSPPYGDNITTVPYGQFSILPLYWIDYKDLKLDGWEFDSYSRIDSKSLGGSAKQIDFDDFEKSLIQPYLNQISIQKKNKVLRFFNDYFKFLKQLCRVTKRYIVMTLGNRTVDRININLTDITIKFMEHYRFKNEQLIEREILNKRTPKRTSKVGNQPVSSMNSEYIIIHKKLDLIGKQVQT